MSEKSSSESGGNSLSDGMSTRALSWGVLGSVFVVVMGYAGLHDMVLSKESPAWVWYFAGVLFGLITPAFFRIFADEASLSHGHGPE